MQRRHLQETPTPYQRINAGHVGRIGVGLRAETGRAIVKRPSNYCAVEARTGQPQHQHLLAGRHGAGEITHRAASVKAARRSVLVRYQSTSKAGSPLR